MNNPTTLAQLVLSAQAAANKAFVGKDTLARQSIKLEEFAAADFARADFPSWENAFNTQLDMLDAFSRQDSPATAAARTNS